jgi:hypothetical protein
MHFHGDLLHMEYIKSPDPHLIFTPVSSVILFERRSTEGVFSGVGQVYNRYTFMTSVITAES